MRDRRIRRIEDDGRFVQIEVGSADGLALKVVVFADGKERGFYTCTTLSGNDRDVTSLTC